MPRWIYWRITPWIMKRLRIASIKLEDDSSLYWHGEAFVVTRLMRDVPYHWLEVIKGQLEYVEDPDA